MLRAYLNKISAWVVSYINYIKGFRISICLAEIFQHYLTASAMFQGGALEARIKRKRCSWKQLEHRSDWYMRHSQRFNQRLGPQLEINTTIQSDGHIARSFQLSRHEYWGKLLARSSLYTIVWYILLLNKLLIALWPPAIPLHKEGRITRFTLLPHL